MEARSLTEHARSPVTPHLILISEELGSEWIYSDPVAMMAPDTRGCTGDGANGAVFRGGSAAACDPAWQ